MTDHIFSKKISGLAWDVWEGHAETNPKAEAIIHWDAVDGPFRWTYGNLRDSALKAANDFITKGIAAGDVCALVMRHNKYFYPIYMGLSAIGAIPAVLAYPNARLHPDKFLHGLSGMAQKSGLDWILTERELEPVIKPVIKQGSSVKNIFFPLEWIDGVQHDGANYDLVSKSRAAIDSSMPLLLQHSSGTTGLQKAVALSHRAVLEHVKRYSGAINLSRKDKVVNWLPLYHDMGLIAAFHMPLAFGIPSVQIDPFQWVSVPAVFFNAISEEKCTVAWLPNFAFSFLADRIPEEALENVRLDSMRMFINCSEVVRAESCGKFINRFQKYGLKKDSLAACYAMAETTFAVTQTRPGIETARIAVDRNALANKIIHPPKAKRSKKVCVSSGKPISGCHVKIIDENGALLPEDRVGTIAIKSVSLFDGYRNDPAKTDQALKGGWYLSGDLGFLHAGECYVIGRRDDIIIVAGKNIFPEDIEDAVNKVEGIIPGRVVAFGVEDEGSGTEDVCVAAETQRGYEDHKDSLTLAIKQAGMEIDVTISNVYLVPPRWLIKSSSGKLSRKANKERILSQTGAHI